MRTIARSPKPSTLRSSLPAKTRKSRPPISRSSFSPSAASYGSLHSRHRPARKQPHRPVANVARGFPRSPAPGSSSAPCTAHCRRQPRHTRQLIQRQRAGSRQRQFPTPPEHPQSPDRFQRYCRVSTTPSRAPSSPCSPPGTSRSRDSFSGSLVCLRPQHPSPPDGAPSAS